MTRTTMTDTLAVTVHDLLWQDPAGAVLRAAMAAEVRGRYADRLGDRTRLPSIVVPVDPDTVAYTGVAYVAEEPVGHLALRRHRRDVEIKRMYVVPEWRGRGVSSALLRAAEDAAGRLGARRFVLQTGDRQPDAVRCFLKHGFVEVPVFAPYKAMAYSRCFAREVDVDA
jgi:GNAT superfamily N-acetyltransferase